MKEKTQQGEKFVNTNPAETQVINVPDGSIRDYVDGKFRKDTPEEYVRQTI